MSDQIITTVFLSENGSACVDRIREVFDGDRNCVELSGVDRRSGTPVTVRICH